jgi:ABC-2 type transport system permease protein
MRRRTKSFQTAVRFQLIQHLRNTFALALVVLFIPFWLTLIHTILPGDDVTFRYRPTDVLLSIKANQLSMISGAINAVTLIIGFMMFVAVRRSGEFDRRLALAGYSRFGLLLAKLVALVVFSVVVALYTTLIMLVFWVPEQPVLMVTSLFVSGLTYGGIGIVFAVVFRSDLPGTFLIIMISLVDVMLQSPIINPSSDGGAVSLLPSYGAMQSGVGAGFTHHVALNYLLWGAQWLTAFALFGTYTFYRRTRDHVQPPDGDQISGNRFAPVTVLLTTNDDGSLAVRSFTGPVLLCSRLKTVEDPADPANSPCRCFTG